LLDHDLSHGGHSAFWVGCCSGVKSREKDSITAENVFRLEYRVCNVCRIQ
jgi:hypothetical protein